MINRIKQIEKARGLKLKIRPKRLRRLYDGDITPNDKDTRSIHKLYVLMLIAEALGGKTVYPAPNVWIIKHARDHPTAIVQLNGKAITIWYQFSYKKWKNVVTGRWIQVFKLQKLAMEGKFEEFARILGVTPKDTAEAELLIYRNLREIIGNRQYVKPDIVLFEGYYKSRDELEKHQPSKVVVIDAKVRLPANDLRQLNEYIRKFRKVFRYSNVYYVVPCIEGAFSRKEYLEDRGCIVIENVAPGKKGEKEFINTIRSLVQDDTYATS